MKPVPWSLAVIVAWIPVTLFLDTRATTAQQWGLGLITTALLVALTVRQPSLVRWQVGSWWCSRRWSNWSSVDGSGCTSTGSVQSRRTFRPATD
jgi:hypothetical protein